MVVLPFISESQDRIHVQVLFGYSLAEIRQLDLVVGVHTLGVVVQLQIGTGKHLEELGPAFVFALGRVEQNVSLELS